MTGPRDDEGVVDLLRAAGHGGREPSPADVSRAMTAGRKIRRRRQATQVLGSGLAVVAVLGVGITTVGALDDDGKTPVTSADDVPAPAINSNTALAAGYLAEDLGEGWRNNDGIVTLDPDSETASNLPDGGYAASATAELVDKAAFDQVCNRRDALTCEEIRTSDGETIYLWDWADRDLQTGELRGEASAYRPLQKGKYQLVVVSVDGPSVSVAQREPRIGTVSSWLTSMEGPLRKAVTDTRIENSLSIEPSLAGHVLAREANIRLLLESLGPDFRKNTREEHPGATLIPGSASAAGLPDGYTVTAEIWVAGQGEGYAGLEDTCTPLVEPGLRRSACEQVQTADGRTVQMQTRHSVLEERKIGGGYDTLLAMFERTDGLVTEVRMQATDTTAKASTSRQETVASWLAEHTDTLATLAADPRVQANPTSGSENATNFTNEEVLADYLAPPFVAVGDGKVEFPAGSAYHPALPSDTYSVVGDITAVTQAQFDAVCKKDGAVSCTERVAPGDRKIWVWSYTDRDATSSEVRGERAVYFIRDDGTIVLASLRLTGTGVSADQSDQHVGQAHLWLEAFDDALSGAATDSRLRFDE